MTPTRMFAVLAVATAVACQEPVPLPGAAEAARTPPSDATAPEPVARNTAVPQGPPRVVVMDEPAVALPHQESFQLLSPGKGPRTALRYTLAPGTAAMMARSTLASRHLEQGRFSRPRPLPAIRDGFEVTIAAAHAERLALRAVIAQAAAASPEASAYLAPWRTLLQGRPVRLALDDRGAITQIRFDDDPSGAASFRARDELVQRLVSLIVVLPDEPVGTGASWRAVTILRQGPAIVKQTATYTLRARGPRRWKLHVKLQRVAERQQITDPELPPSTSAELVALSRALEGDVEVDPTLPLIAGGSLKLEARLHARLAPGPAPGQASQPAIVEQIFEDTGRVSFSRCRPIAAAARARSAGSRAANRRFAECPDGFAPR